MKFKIGDNVKFTRTPFIYFCDSYPANIPPDKIVHGSTTIGSKYLKEVTPEIVDIYEEYYIVKFPTDNKNGYTQLGFEEDMLELVAPKVKFSIEYDEPLEEEMDDNCVAQCRPGDHKCDRKKEVLIKLIQIGRNKMNEEFKVIRNGKTEEQLAELALKRCKEYLMSNDIGLEPNEEKGEGFWKLRVGMGYHVGDVEIIL